MTERESCNDDDVRVEPTRASRLWNVASVLVVRGGGCWLISHATGLDFEAVMALYLGVVLLVIKVKR